MTNTSVSILPMQPPKKTLHEISFPGNFGQRCTCKYYVGSGRESPGITRTDVLIVEDASNPGGTPAHFQSAQSSIISKIFGLHLGGCRLDFIDVYYLALPGVVGKRRLFRWRCGIGIDSEQPVFQFRTLRKRHEFLHIFKKFCGLKPRAARRETWDFVGSAPVQVVGFRELSDDEDRDARRRLRAVLEEIESAEQERCHAPI